MKIQSGFIREQKYYTYTDLANIFIDKTEEELHNIISKLIKAGVLTETSQNKLELSELENNDEITDLNIGEDEKIYSFPFVGIISVGGHILKCYPKYLHSLPTTTLAKEDYLNDKIRRIFKVIEKYQNSKIQTIRNISEIDLEKAFNLLPLILYLLNDYYENGVYTNTQSILEINGSGAINWDKTINETVTILSEDRSYYVELKTRKVINNTADFFRRLHCCILTQCSKDLEETGLLDIFDMPNVYLSDEILEDFGDPTYIKDRLQKELNVVFNTHKQELLQKLINYVMEESYLTDDDCCTFYGSKSFNLIWEDVCSVVLKNQLNEKIKNLPIPNSLKEKYRLYPNLLEIIEKPKWQKTGSNSAVKVADTLKPDIVTLKLAIFQEQKSYKFLIFDAKYYDMKLLENKVSGQPGVGDLTKQYLYQLAFKKFTEDLDARVVKNCFIMPTEKNETIKTGIAFMEMLNELNLEPILIRHVSAEKMYEHYLSGTALKYEELKLEEDD